MFSILFARRKAHKYRTVVVTGGWWIWCANKFRRGHFCLCILKFRIWILVQTFLYIRTYSSLIMSLFEIIFHFYLQVSFYSVKTSKICAESGAKSIIFIRS